jgi:hypothetical protein
MVQYQGDSKRILKLWERVKKEWTKILTSVCQNLIESTVLTHSIRLSPVTKGAKKKFDLIFRCRSLIRELIFSKFQNFVQIECVSTVCLEGFKLCRRQRVVIPSTKTTIFDFSKNLLQNHSMSLLQRTWCYKSKNGNYIITKVPSKRSEWGASYIIFS